MGSHLHQFPDPNRCNPLLFDGAMETPLLQPPGGPADEIGGEMLLQEMAASERTFMKALQGHVQG
ncbi:MAG: hypothetical protein ACUVSF_04615 [Anaerolineae bacterium]